MKRNMLLLASLVLSIAPSTAAPGLKDRKDDDKARIVGNWKQEALCMRGGRMDTERTGSFRFGSDGSCGISSGGGKENGALYTLDPSTTPRRMKWLNGPEKTEWQCLYELDGDTLKVAFVDHGTEAPKKIEPAPNLTIYYLKRMKE